MYLTPPTSTPTNLQTPRLVLRPFCLDDLEPFYNYSKNPNVGRNAGWKPHESVIESLEILNLIFLDKENMWAMVIKETNQLIGSIGLTDDPKRLNPNVKMMGYAIGEEHWGKGYTTEAAKKVVEYAFGKLKLDLVSAYTYPNNLRSQKVLEKCGFLCEGSLKLAEILYTGEIMDNKLFSLQNPSHKQPNP